MIIVVNEFAKYVKELPELIANSYYKSEYFADKLNLKLPTYYRKLRENTFTLKEIEVLTKLLYPKEAMLAEIKEDLKIADEDFKEGRIKKNADVLKDLKKKYLHQ